MPFDVRTIRELPPDQAHGCTGGASFGCDKVVITYNEREYIITPRLDGTGTGNTGILITATGALDAGPLYTHQHDQVVVNYHYRTPKQTSQ